MIEPLARIPVEVDIASEFRYRNPVIDPSVALLTITQSGETVDTLAAMELADAAGLPAVDDHQCHRLAGASHERRRDLDSRRAGNRRGVDQDVHRFASGYVSAGLVSGPAARHARSGARCGSWWMIWRGCRI